MNRRQIELRQKIARSRGIAESVSFFEKEFHDPTPFGEAAKVILSRVPPSFGSCVMLSSAWASYLKDHYSISAIVVAGDLKISGARVFRYKEKLPERKAKGRLIRKSWGGHCWVEVNGYLGDLSIFRTAYAIGGPSLLKDFIENRFGAGRGALLSPISKLPDGMLYVPQQVLKDSQVDMFTASLSYQLEHGI